MDIKNREFDVSDKITSGLRQVRSGLELTHPIEVSEKNFHLNSERGAMENLRRMQGQHAPLKIQMEKKLVSRFGHLPCITTRTNLSADILNGTDLTIGFEDFLGQPETFEGHCNPHDAIEMTLPTPFGIPKSAPKTLF